MRINNVLLLSLLMGLCPFLAKATCKKINASQGCIKELRAGDVDVKGTLSIFGPVEDRIGRTYVVGIDIPTIQAGIDLASSGLKPDSASNVVPLPAGAKNVTIQIPAGTYHETLFIDTDLSDPQINDSGTDLLNLPGRGLRLEGDMRPIAAMTYMNGGLVETDSTYCVNSGLNSLGTLNSVVTLTNTGNTITVINTPGPNPAFDAAGIVQGDIIVVTDVDGTTQQRNVVSVAGNTVTYDGSPVTISGNGAALTFCPNVHVIAAVSDAACYITSGGVELVGIWLDAIPGGGYCLFVTQSGFIYPNNLLVDGRNLGIPTVYVGPALNIFGGGNMRGAVADGNISGHISILGGSLGIGEFAYVNGGNYYVMSNPNQTFATAEIFTSSAFLAYSLQLNGSNQAVNGYSVDTNAEGRILTVLSAFNCYNACGVFPGASSRVAYFNINGSQIGISATNGEFVDTAASPFHGHTSTISNSVTAIQAGLKGAIVTAGPLIMQNCGVGVQLTSSSNFTNGNNVTFTSVTDPYAIDATSTYNTPANAGTDPSPNNIFTYSSAGSPVMNSAYLKQLLDSAGVVNVQLNPGLTAAGTLEYVGKTYTLTAITAGPHILTLLGGATFLDGTSFKTFTGIGSTLTIQIDSATRVAILSNIGVV